MFDAGESQSEVMEGNGSSVDTPNSMDSGKEENIDSNGAGDGAKLTHTPIDSNMADERVTLNNIETEIDKTNQIMAQDKDIDDTSDKQVKDANRSVDDSSITHDGLTDETNNENTICNEARENAANPDPSADVIHATGKEANETNDSS